MIAYGLWMSLEEERGVLGLVGLEYRSQQPGGSKSWFNVRKVGVVTKPWTSRLG